MKQDLKIMLESSVNRVSTSSIKRTIQSPTEFIPTFQSDELTNHREEMVEIRGAIFV